MPRGVAQKRKLAAAIAEVERILGADVVRLRYTIGVSWSDEPAIFFRVLLSDQASKRDRLHEVASRVEAVIQERLDPLNAWGLVPYYNFRSVTEQEMLKEPAWA
ncbi:MAG TPA: hypothetical protein VK419_03810 [Bryobacteraceae bacterium]|nr:hypothetical protein [Bryobacteraceae bacterium]